MQMHSTHIPSNNFQFTRFSFFRIHKHAHISKQESWRVCYCSVRSHFARHRRHIYLYSTVSIARAPITIVIIYFIYSSTCAYTKSLRFLYLVAEQQIFSIWSVEKRAAVCECERASVRRVIMKSRMLQPKTKALSISITEFIYAVGCRCVHK